MYCGKAQEEQGRYYIINERQDTIFFYDGTTTTSVAPSSFSLGKNIQITPVRLGFERGTLGKHPDRNDRNLIQSNNNEKEEALVARSRPIHQVIKWSIIFQRSLCEWATIQNLLFLFYNGGSGRAGIFGGGGGGVSSLMSAKLLTGRGGFSGGTSAGLAEICCLAGSGGGWSSLDEELRVDAMLFCDGDEQTPSPLSDRLTVDERLSLAASERSGRLAVNCCVSSMTGEPFPLFSTLLLGELTASDDDASSELTLKPIDRGEKAIRRDSERPRKCRGRHKMERPRHQLFATFAKLFFTHDSLRGRRSERQAQTRRDHLP